MGATGEKERERERDDALSPNYSGVSVFICFVCSLEVIERCCQVSSVVGGGGHALGIGENNFMRNK
jgi:hypothetical protein